MKHLLNILAVASFAVFATALAAAQPPADPAAIAAIAAGPPREPAGPLALEKFWQWQPLSARYDVTDNTRADFKASMSLVAPADPSAPWEYKRLGQRVERVRRAADGSVMLESLVNLDKNIIAKFTPALCVMTATLDPGSVHETKAEMFVVSREHPKHKKADGTGVMTVVYDADQTLTTPAGKFECHRIRVTCDADFGLGSTHSVSTYYYADKIGLVAECYDSQSTLLMISSERHIRSILLEMPEIAAAPTAAAQ